MCCPDCANELEVLNVETIHPFPESNLTKIYHCQCNRCGKKFHFIQYFFLMDYEIKEIEE